MSVRESAYAVPLADATHYTVRYIDLWSAV